MGNGYSFIGDPVSGGDCLNWNSVPNPYANDLVFQSLDDLQNYCENIVGGNPWPTPSCLIEATNGDIYLSPCSVVGYCREFDLYFLKWANSHFHSHFHLDVYYITR